MPKPLVASLVWKLPSGLHEAQADAVQRLGYPHRYLLFDDAIPQDTGIVLVQGPYGTLLPLVRQLVDWLPESRPALAYWFGESLSLFRPEWVRRVVSTVLSELVRAHGELGWLGSSLSFLPSVVLRTKGARLRFLGDILWLHRHGLLDVLALSSTLYADYLGSLGVDSIVVPRGCHPSYGRVLGLRRDVALVWMGKLRNRRRRNAVGWLRKELEKRGQTMLVFDGQENDFIFGERRTQILNRAWFVLNVFTNPVDELSIRHFIAGANGAVVITEPGKNRYPFVPGEHLVECPIEEMPDRIMYYMEHEQEWCALSENMLNLIQNELTLEKSVGRILSAAEAVLQERRP